MTPRIILAAEARTALIAAVSWWRANRPLAPRLLLEESERALRLLMDLPEVGTKYDQAPFPGVRKIFLRRSSYWIFYLHDRDNSIIYILTIWSTARGSDPPLRKP